MQAVMKFCTCPGVWWPVSTNFHISGSHSFPSHYDSESRAPFQDDLHLVVVVKRTCVLELSNRDSSPNSAAHLPGDLGPGIPSF